MADIFCGAGNVPKGKKLGTAKQCVDKGQIRHWGNESIGKELKEKPKGEMTLKKATREKNKVYAEIQGITKRFKKAKEAYLFNVEKFKDDTTKKTKKRLEGDKKKLETIKKKHAKLAAKHAILKDLEAKLAAEE